MTRLFSEKALGDKDSLTLNEEDSKYISQVLRMRIGEEVVVVDKDGVECICEVAKIDKKTVELDIKSKRENNTEPPLKVTLYQSVSKGERMDLTIQKTTELGVYEIVPVMSERCVAKADKNDAKKIDRWQKIALEAARQSGRGIVPRVRAPISFAQAIGEIEGYDLAIFPWEEETGKGLKKALQSLKGSKVALFTGPEGGYEAGEAESALEAGAVRVTLGPRILRTETAAAAVLAMIIYEKEI